MDERPGATARRVLHALADLSPAAEQRATALAVPTEWFRWLPGAAGVECEVHPDGPDAHIERHLALCRAGWHLAGAYGSRWAGRGAELVVELVRELAAPPKR
jgi:hypothetical protein